MAAARWVKRLAWTLLLLAVAAPAGLLALLNRGHVDVDLAFAEFSLSKPLAFTAVFGLGWLFGVLCAAGALLRRRAASRNRTPGKDVAVGGG